MSKNKPEIREPLIDALAKSPMLRFLGKNDPRGRTLREMLESGAVHQFSDGDTIITQGDKSDAMYVLASGSVGISLNGNEVCVMDQPGEVFGEFGVLTGDLRSASVTARGDVTCFAVSATFTARKALEEDDLFQRLMQQALIKILLGRLRQSNEEVVQLKKSLHTAENQVAFLRMDNDMLNHQLDAIRAESSEGLRGTRAGGSADP